jgi:hypothetical protein
VCAARVRTVRAWPYLIRFRIPALRCATATGESECDFVEEPEPEQGSARAATEAVTETVTEAGSSRSISAGASGGLSKGRIGSVSGGGGGGVVRFAEPTAADTVGTAYTPVLILEETKEPLIERDESSPSARQAETPPGNHHHSTGGGGAGRGSDSDSDGGFGQPTQRPRVRGLRMGLGVQGRSESRTDVAMRYQYMNNQMLEDRVTFYESGDGDGKPAHPLMVRYTPAADSSLSPLCRGSRSGILCWISISR